MEIDLESHSSVAGLHYVALSRCKTEGGNKLIDDLFENQISASGKVIEEMHRMRLLCQMPFHLNFPLNSNRSLLFHNVESLRKYIGFVKASIIYRNLSMLVFCESRLLPKDEDSHYFIPGYRLRRFDWPAVSTSASRPHAGICVYVNDDLQQFAFVEKRTATSHFVLIETHYW